MQETWVQSLGQEDPLEKEMATHSSILVRGNSHGQRSLVGYSPWGNKESDMTEGQNSNIHVSPPSWFFLPPALHPTALGHHRAPT